MHEEIVKVCELVIFLFSWPVSRYIRILKNMREMFARIWLGRYSYMVIYDDWVQRSTRDGKTLDREVCRKDGRQIERPMRNVKLFSKRYLSGAVGEERKGQHDGWKAYYECGSVMRFGHWSFNLSRYVYISSISLCKN